MPLKRQPLRRRLGFSFLLFLFIPLTFFFFPFSVFSQSPAHQGMVYIPSGYFQMGTSSGSTEDEQPMHFIYTDAYYIDKYEVSNAQYQEFIESTGRTKPKFWDDERFNKPELPVVGVSWDDAMEYAKWKGRRLPTEAEWEKAARGNDDRQWPWGKKWDNGFYFYFVNIFGTDDNYDFTAPVDYYEAGASPFGVFNMAGNVWEWCLDWYDEKYYRFSPEVNPEGPASGKMKVLRGGSWINDINSVRLTKRARNHPNIKNEIYGFRTALSAQ